MDPNPDTVSDLDPSQTTHAENKFLIFVLFQSTNRLKTFYFHILRVKNGFASGTEI